MKEKKLGATASASLTISTHNLPRSSFEMSHVLPPRSTKNRKTAGSTKFMQQMMMPPPSLATARRTSIRQPAASNSTSLMSLKSSATSNTAAAAAATTVKRSGSRAVGALPIVKQRTI